MSKCPSTSKRKRKAQTTGQSDCKKPVRKKMAWDSHKSIEDFGYKFNEEGRLVDTDGNGFNFYVTDDHWYNQKHYEKLGEVITEYVYELLLSEDVGLEKIEIPKEKESSILSFKNKDKKNKETAKGFIFVSEDFDKKEKLLILVHGSGVVRAGQWARRLIINDCLDHGTQIPYIKRAIKEGYGVVVTNTNQNEAAVEVNEKKSYKTIKESESPERHYSYVWKNIIEKTEASKMFLVGHSYGGYLIVDYFSRFPKIQHRVVAVAFTDSVHSFHSHSRAQAKGWFLKNSRNWITSSFELDTPMQYQDDDKYITRVSAGTTKHEETSWKAMESVFQYFKEQELDFKSSNEEKTSGKGKSGGGKKRGMAANLNRKDKIEKRSDHSKSGKNHGKDGMNNYAEGAQEQSENSEDASEEQDHETEEKRNDMPGDGSDLKLSTETKEPYTDTAADVVQPTGRDEHIDATFMGSIPSGANQTSTSDEITNTSNQKKTSLENNDDMNSENPEQSETIVEDENQTASNPGETSNSETGKKVVVEAKYIKGNDASFDPDKHDENGDANPIEEKSDETSNSESVKKVIGTFEAKDMKRNDASLDTNKHEDNVDTNLVEGESDKTSNLDPLGKIPVVTKSVKDIADETDSNVNKNRNEKEGAPSSNTGDAINEHTEEQREIKPKTNKDEQSLGVQSSNTERPNSNNVREPINSEDAGSTALSGKHGENNEVNITDKKSDHTSKLEPTRRVVEEKDVKENGASSGIISDEHEESFEKKSEGLHTCEETDDLRCKSEEETSV